MRLTLVRAKLIAGGWPAGGQLLLLHGTVYYLMGITVAVLILPVLHKSGISPLHSRRLARTNEDSAGVPAPVE